MNDADRKSLEYIRKHNNGPQHETVITILIRLFDESQAEIAELQSKLDFTALILRDVVQDNDASTATVRHVLTLLDRVASKPGLQAEAINRCKQVVGKLIGMEIPDYAPPAYQMMHGYGMTQMVTTTYPAMFSVVTSTGTPTRSPRERRDSNYPQE